MSPRLLQGLVLAVLIATAGLWALLEGLVWPARAMATFLLGPLPALLLLQARYADQVPEQARREEVYVSSAVSVWGLAALAMLASRFGGLTRADLLLTSPGPARLLGAAGLTTLAGLGVMALGRALKLRESTLVEFLIPRTGSEKIAFTGLSISAGIGEELVFRSFLIAAVHRATGSLPLAVTASIGAFAVAHAYQGVTGVARVTLLGLILTAPYLLTGSVYPSMLAHAALDILAGLVLADWLRDGGGGH